ncbi:unnamed protein product [Phaedon cochleariae]|uniref:DUF4806 domain-containing protein n=1 Tax=Phaedon cochleariae TaxID=80249 RepID=A0A9P0DTN8_PHACE|nr:unnamed protein product [Phaedon cochleariae]
MNKQYSCIIFCNESDVNEESVAEVPITWLDETNTICKWPPSPALVSLYINRYKTPMDNWISYNVKVTATFATLEEARNFNKGESNVSCSGRRLVKSPDIYSPDEFLEPRKVKRPTLPPNIDHSNIRPLVQSYNEDSPENYPDKVYTVLQGPNRECIESEDDISEASGYNSEPISYPSMESGPHVASVSAPADISKETRPHVASVRAPDIPKETAESCLNDRIINLLLDIKLEIGTLTNKLTEQGLLNVESDPILETLPLKNLEDFRSLEGKVNTDPILKKKLYKTYESIGGNGSRDFVIRCLKRSFTNEMAELCSWTGQKDNYKVADSPVLKLLYMAVKKTTGVSEKDFEICVKDWLRHAKQRKERMLKKNNE